MVEYLTNRSGDTRSFLKLRMINERDKSSPPTSDNLQLKLRQICN